MLSSAAASSALKTLPAARVADEQSSQGTPAEQFVNLLQQLVHGDGLNVVSNVSDIDIDTKVTEPPPPPPDSSAGADAKQSVQGEEQGAQKSVEKKSDDDSDSQDQNADVSVVAASTLSTNQSSPQQPKVETENAFQPGTQSKTVGQTAQQQDPQAGDSVSLPQGQVLKPVTNNPASTQAEQSVVQNTVQAGTQPLLAGSPTLDPAVNAGVKAGSAAEAIKEVPLAESEKALLVANPQLAEPPKAAPAQQQAVVASALVSSAKLSSEAGAAAASSVRQQSLTPSMELSRTSVLEKALQEISADRGDISSALLMGDKAKLTTTSTKDTGKSGVTSQQEKVIVQIQKLMDQAAKLRDGTSLTVKIEPEELGQVTVKVTQRGDQLYARIIPEKKEVETTVRLGVPEIVAHLAAAGFKADNIHVSIGRTPAEGSQYSPKQQNSGASSSSGQGKSGQDEGGGVGTGSRHGSSKASGSGLQLSTVVAGENQVADGGWVA